MFGQLLNELMNIVFGNSRYVRYSTQAQLFFLLLLGLLLFFPLLLPYLM